MIGNQRPRISCVPEDIQDSLGPEATKLAAKSGLILDDWQSWSLDNMMAVNSNHKWAAFEACEIVGRQMGKGGILEARELAGLFLVPYEIEILHTAHEYDTAIKHFYRLISDIDANSELSRKCKKPNLSHGQEAIQLIPTATRIMGSDSKYVTKSVSKKLEIKARTIGAGRGFTGDLVVLDEAMILDSKPMGALVPTLTTRPNAQLIYMASAGLGVKSSQLGRVRRRGIKGEPKLFYGEWSIEPHNEYCPVDCKLHIEIGSREAYAMANPAMGIRATEEYFANERRAMPEDEWLRERMGIGVYPATDNGWLVIPRTWYNATRDNNPEPPRVTSPIFAIDAAPNRRSASIAVVGKRPDNLAGLQVIDHQKGTGWIVESAVGINNRWHPYKWIIDRRAAAGSLVKSLEDAGLPLEFVQATEVGHACGQIYDGFRDDTLRHYGQKELESAIAGVDWRKLLNSFAFDRANSGSDISPLMAVTFAYWGYLRFGMDADYDASDQFLDVWEITRLYNKGVYGPDDIKRLFDDGLINQKDLEALRDAGIRF